MTRIALVMHEPLGQAFASCAAHVFGGEPELYVFDVPADADPDERVQALVDTLMAGPANTEPVLMLCDIFGATPFNIANRARKLVAERGVNVHLIAGSNLCMVLKALAERQDNPDQLAEEVRVGALRGVVDADACGY